MKNVKKILVLAAMLSVLCALMCVNAFAAGGTIESITKDNVNANFTVGSEYYSAYELKVFATDADDTWAPKYEVDTIPLLNN